MTQGSEVGAGGLQTQEVRGPFGDGWQERRRFAPWGTAATICTIAGTTSRIWRRTASLKKWRICWCTANCPMRRNWRHTKQACGRTRSLPATVKQALELLPATAQSDGRAAHRRVRDGLRARRSARRMATPGHVRIADLLLASLGSMLLYWHHYALQREAH